MDTNSTVPDAPIIAATRFWIEQAVIGLDLCPFAKVAYDKNQIRYVVSTAETAEALLADLICELHALVAADADDVETTLLIHPGVLADFLDYNDFLDHADATIVASGLDGEIQIASFHPRYQFAGSAPDDIENYTNRSPYPMLHLLRESSIERGLAAFPEAAQISDKNLATLRRIGHDGWNRLKIAAAAPDVVREMKFEKAL